MGEAAVDVIVVGAGPTGLSCAIECGRLGLSVRVLEQGCIVHSIHRYPTEMVFFTTKERMEIGGLPLPVPHAKPTRAEALAYYRSAAAHFGLDVQQYQTVTGITGEDGAFEIATRDRFGREWRHGARRVVLAVGYFDHPGRLGVEGEDLPHVHHAFRDGHETAGSDVIVVGGGNSAAEAALEMFRAGARVTMVVRASDFHPSLKYWVRPDLANRIKDGEIGVRLGTRVTRFGVREAEVVAADGARERLVADHAFVLVGFRPDVELLAACGVDVDKETLRPVMDTATFESRVPGIYMAGAVIAGRETSEIFIENGRHHATVIAPAIAARVNAARRGGA